MEWNNNKLLLKTRSHVFKKKSNSSMSYVIQDLCCLLCQEEKLILLNLRQILTTGAHRRTEDAPVEVEFPSERYETFLSPTALGSRLSSGSFYVIWKLSVLSQVKWAVKCTCIPALKSGLRYEMIEIPGDSPFKKDAHNNQVLWCLLKDWETAWASNA